MTEQSGSSSSRPDFDKLNPRLHPNDILRFLLELFALFSLGFWGYLAWPFPWPGILFTIGTPLFAAVVWGLFRSPKAVFPLDPVGRVLVELFVMGAAAATWFMLGYWVVGLVFGIVAAVSGFINGRREFSTEAS
jgi:glucan phosphoethanolaminetransferase (alkaline phosphatase superfamily)